MVLSHSFAPPTSLLRYEVLHSRKQLSSRESQRYEQLKKGFIGEKRLEVFLRTDTYQNIIPLFDCLFEVDEREFQIDCILLTSDTIFLLEVKNYTGNYYIQNNQVHHLSSKKQIYNPVTQLDRTEFLFRKLLTNMRVNMKVRSFVVFVDFNFVLYGASEKLPMIFAPQIKIFLQKINENTRPLLKDVKQLADKLAHRCKESSAYERRPEYHLDELKRGVFCDRCLAELVRENQYNFKCTRCEEKFNIDHVVLFAIAQYHLLFPKKKIRTRKIINWCGNQVSKNPIRRILSNNFIISSKGNRTHYVYPDELIPLEILSSRYVNLK